MEDYVKRFVTKDGKHRVTIYYDEDADNPRYNTDEPLHCEDWCRNYSIMTKKERESKSSSACDLIGYLLERYGRLDRIIQKLKADFAANVHREGDNGLAYDRSRKEWVLYSWSEGFKAYNGEVIPSEWREEWSWSCKLEYITLQEMVEHLNDDTIDDMCAIEYWTDEVKTASYSFGYNGEVSFSDEISCDSDGIAWLEKDEFLKYSGCKEDYWKGKTLKEIEYLTDELEAWGDNEVYGFIVEDAVRVITNIRYPDGEHDDTETEEIKWETTDSCYGFYGELDKSLERMLDYAGFKKEELTEE